MKQPKNKPAADLYPGASIDKADREKVDPKLVKQETRILNDNPRDNDNKMP